jgi:hypothetical protein
LTGPVAADVVLGTVLAVGASGAVLLGVALEELPEVALGVLPASPASPAAEGVPLPPTRTGTRLEAYTTPPTSEATITPATRPAILVFCFISALR